MTVYTHAMFQHHDMVSACWLIHVTMVVCTYNPVGTCHVPVPSTTGVGHTCSHTCHVPAAPCDADGTSDHMLPMSQHCDMVVGTCTFTKKQILASLHGDICMLAHAICHNPTPSVAPYAMSLCHQVWHWAYLSPYMPCHRIAFTMDSSVYTNSLSQCNHVAVNVHTCLHTSSVLALPFGSMALYVLL